MNICSEKSNQSPSLEKHGYRLGDNFMSSQRPSVPLRITVVGSLPPPLGGVATSIKSLLHSAKGLESVDLRVISWHQMWRLPFHRPDVLHLNFSKPVKRMWGTLIGLLCGSSVIHTIHGDTFNFDRLGNRVACSLSQGFILLNTRIMERFSKQGIENITLMTPIFDINSDESSQPLDSTLNEFLRKDNWKTALVYSSDRKKIGGKDIYGFEFIVSMLPRLAKLGWQVIFLDPNGNFKTEKLFDPSVKNAYLHCAPVDFKNLLKLVNLYLRPTSTDGNSVAVLEALAIGTPVLASDAVPRPDGVIIYDVTDGEDFIKKIHLVSSSNLKPLAVSVTKISQYVEYMKNSIK